jgi:hypothetical protein
MSGATYARAKYIEENAPKEVIEQLDKGERKIRPTYDEVRAKETAEPSAKPKRITKVPDSYFSKQDREAMQKIKEFAAMSNEEKIVELQRRLKEERARAAHAESELSRVKDILHNTTYHGNANIENLKMQIASRDKALEKAEARIKELESATSSQVGTSYSDCEVIQ